MEAATIRVLEKGVPSRRKAPAKRGFPAKAPRWLSMRNIRAGLTAVMGLMIPAMSFGLSTWFGTLAQSGDKVKMALAAGAGFLLVAVLAISLPHLAAAIRDITGCTKLPARLLAVSFDCYLCLGELILIYDPAGLKPLVVAMMIGVAVMSAALNCWAFFRCRHAKARR